MKSLSTVQLFPRFFYEHNQSTIGAQLYDRHPLFLLHVTSCFVTVIVVIMDTKKCEESKFAAQKFGKFRYSYYFCQTKRIKQLR